MWWPRMNIDARQFVKTCAQCQRGNTRFDKAATMQLNCIQSLSLVRFGTKLEWICAAYPIQMKDLFVFVLL